jgi:hypothetical protein
MLMNVEVLRRNDRLPRNVFEAGVIAPIVVAVDSNDVFSGHEPLVAGVHIAKDGDTQAKTLACVIEMYVALSVPRDYTVLDPLCRVVEVGLRDGEDFAGFFEQHEHAKTPMICAS